MPVELAELTKLVLGVCILTIPGYLWSFLFAKQLTSLERCVFGFLVSLVVLTCGIFFFNTVFIIKITQSVILLLFATYTIPALILYGISLKKSGIPKIGFQPLKNKKYLLLLLILAFSVFMAFLPHLTNNYYLPFHVDEWEHFTFSRAVIETGSTTFANPYTGEGMSFHPEIGFQVASGCLHWISGADLLTIFVFMPSVLIVFLSLTAFNIGERATRKFGLEAAFLVAFIPTTVRFLGPSFYVAITLGLVLLLFIIWLGQLKTIQGAFFIAGFILCLFIIHPPTALAAMLILLLYTVFLIIEKQYKIAGVIGLLTVLPLLPIYYLTTRWNSTFEVVLQAVSGQEYLLDLNLPKIWVNFEHLGLVTWACFAIGAYFCFSKGRALLRTLCVSALMFLIVIGVYDKFGYGIPIIYERSFLYLFLLVAIVAGVGLSELRKTLQQFTEKTRVKRASKTIGLLVPLIVGLILISTAVPAHQNISYYQMITDQDYESFTWINTHINDYRNANHTYDRVAVDPFIASPFTAITGVHTISSSMSPLYGYELHTEMDKFMREKCTNTSFLKKYNIGVVYGACINNNLTMIHPNVYLYPGLYTE